MENRRLIISEGSPEIKGSLFIDAILEDGRKIFGFWSSGLFAGQYSFHVSCLDEDDVKAHTYKFRSLSAMICAFNSKQILTIDSDGGIVL